MNIINLENNRQCLKNVSIGKDVKISNFVNAYECSIGDGSKIGAFVEIQKKVIIGRNCKISSHTFICEGVNIANNVFIGHNVSFINDKYPRAVNNNGILQDIDDWKVIETRIEDGASIGTSSTILCGITVGKNAIVGAGSVVTKSVPENAIAVGNPARVIRYIK